MRGNVQGFYNSINMSYHCIKQGVLLIPRSSELSADLLPESTPCLLSITHHRVNEYLQLATLSRYIPRGHKHGNIGRTPIVALKCELNYWPPEAWKLRPELAIQTLVGHTKSVRCIIVTHCSWMTLPLTMHPRMYRIKSQLPDLGALSMACL